MKSVAETLGYPDFATMAGKNGIMSEIRQFRKYDEIAIDIEMMKAGEVGIYFWMADMSRSDIYEICITEQCEPYFYE